MRAKISSLIKQDAKNGGCKHRSGTEIKMQDVVILSQSGRTLTARVLCEIDHHTAKPIREGIDKALFEKKPELLVLDFSEVRFMDSSGIGLIIGRTEVCRALGAHVRVVSLSPLLSRLVRLSGIEKIKNLSIG